MKYPFCARLILMQLSHNNTKICHIIIEVRFIITILYPVQILLKYVLKKSNSP